jgi:type II intron maturase
MESLPFAFRKHVVEKKTAIYEPKGKPVRRTPDVHCTDYTILNTSQQEYRGLVQYYLLANNIHWLGRVRWAAERSLTCTLAAKHRCRAAEMAKQYRTIIQTPHGPRTCGDRNPLTRQ